MHKGRNYPYYPYYWATESWFWPGFVPWKMRSILAATPGSPWDNLATPFDAISEAGEVVPDCTQISYHYPLEAPSTATDLYVSLEMITVDDVHFARWKAILRNSGSLVAEAWLYQDFPQYSVSTGITGWNLINVVLPTSPFLYLICQPATYEEGGSPWD